MKRTLLGVTVFDSHEEAREYIREYVEVLAKKSVDDVLSALRNTDPEYAAIRNRFFETTDALSNGLSIQLDHDRILQAAVRVAFVQGWKACSLSHPAVAVIPANTWGLRQADSTVNEEDACAREAAASSVAE